jgi:antitoxin component of MazEF toxin-antitoxin module
MPSRNRPNKKNVVKKAGDREVSYANKIRAIGNSTGVILNNQPMEAAGIGSDADVVVQAKDGVVYIMEAKANTDLATWDKLFKAAIKKGATPEKDLFEGLNNEFDNKEWQ